MYGGCAYGVHRLLVLNGRASGFKKGLEGLDCPFDKLRERVVYICISVNGGDGVVGDATGDDACEMVEVGVDVEGESVLADAVACDFDADGGDFVWGVVLIDPDACVAGEAVGGDVDFGEGVDHDLFEVAEVAVSV